MPQPFSPYHWKVIIRNGETYHVSYINLISDTIYKANANSGLFEQLDALYKPINKNEWLSINQYGGVQAELAKQVWQMDIMKPIRHFMMFPAVDTLRQGITKDCIWFKDHRFVLDGVRQGPFRFGACQDKQSKWKLYRFRDGNRVPLFK